VAKNWKAPSPPARADWWARIPAYVALAVSGLSFALAYETVLPSLAAKVEFVKALTAGENFNVKIDIDNNGNSTAKQIRPDLHFGLAPATVDFEPYGPGLNINTITPDWKPTVSDLGPRGHTTIVSTTPMNFANDASVRDVIAGRTKFYIYGKIPYRDVLHLGHEFHFCFFYLQTPGIDPLSLLKCPSYNDTD
jgi:hypothetical protein